MGAIIDYIRPILSFWVDYYNKIYYVGLVRKSC